MDSQASMEELDFFDEIWLVSLYASKEVRVTAVVDSKVNWLWANSSGLWLRVQCPKFVNRSTYNKLIGRSRYSDYSSTSRFTNIAAPDGHFSIKYIFPDIGLYQVITKITSGSHDVSSLASFVVNIQVQPLALNLFGRNYIFWISAIIATSTGITSFFIVKYAMYKD